MSTTQATRTAVERLLDEAAHRGHTATRALDASDETRAHDELASARSLLDVACILTDPEETLHPGRDPERLERYTAPDGLSQLDLDAGIVIMLGRAGLDTIPDLRQALDAGTITDIRGIGPRRVQLLTEALAAFDAPRLRLA
jgi:hypothetical protein